MTIARSFLLVAVILAAHENAWAEGIQISIRPHVRRVVLGDPLYLEVTFVNKGDTAVAGPLPHPDLGTFEFRVFRPQ